LRFPLKVVRLVLAWAQEGGSGPRLVADACATPVLRDQGPIGRPGTARPMFALGSPNVARGFLDHALPRARLLRLTSKGCAGSVASRRYPFHTKLVGAARTRRTLT
jgi:hypothetical protein